MRERTPLQTVNIHSLGEVREFLRESMESEVHDFTQNGIGVKLTLERYWERKRHRASESVSV